MRRWQLREARNKFSEVVSRALNEGPQLVTRNGKPAVVILSVAEYERLSARNPGPKGKAAPKKAHRAK
jgi:prevent-host-death family protein